MTDPRALLGRLTASAPDPARIPGRSHGSLTASDIAASLSGLNRPLELLLRIKYCGDNSGRIELACHTVETVDSLSHTYGWRVDSDRLQKLVALALEYVLDPPRCPACLGRGTKRKRTGVLAVCQKCAGTGQHEESEASRARAVGVEPSSWHRVWRSRWRDIVSMLEGWERKGLAQVRYRLGE